MKTRDYFLQGVLTAFVAFLAAAAVTYFYRLIAHGEGAVNWETAFELAIVLGIVLPMVSGRDSRARQRN